MPLRFNGTVLSRNMPCRVVYRGLLLLLALLLLVGTSAAQSEQETKLAEASRLYTAAVQLYQEGSKVSREQALQKLQQARLLFQSVNESLGEANSLYGIGRIYADSGEKQKALDNYALALPIYRAAGHRPYEALLLANIGLAYDSLGEKQKALDNYTLALSLYRAVGDREEEATTLTRIGRVYDSQGEKQKALDNYAVSLPIFRALGNRSWEASTLTDTGRAYAALGETQKALDNYALALPLSRAVGNRRGEAITLNSLGTIYLNLGENQKALDNYTLALPIFRALGDRSWEASTLDGIGSAYNELGEKQKALDNYALALSLYRATGARDGEANTLNNIGLVYEDLGELQKALDYYTVALQFHRAAGNRAEEATTLNNIGAIYKSVGELQKALDYYSRGLPLRRAIGDRRGEAIAYNNIGTVYDYLGEKQKALDNYALALSLIRAVGARSVEATTLGNIGRVYADLGEKQKALDYYALALPLSRAVGNRLLEAIVLTNIGRAYADLGERQKALDNYALALPLKRATGARDSEAATLYRIAICERDRGNLTEARSNIEAALAIIESLRTKIANQDLRASYFATVQDYYEFYIDLLMRLHKQSPNAGHDGEALQTSERARARALLEMLAEANADIRQGVDPKLVERERSLQQRLNAKAQAQMKLLSGPHTDEQGKTITGDIEALTTEFQQVETQIRQTSPRYAALTQPRPLTLKEIQTQVLDADTILLEYSLGAERSYLWTVSPTTITSYDLPKRSVIEDASRRLYDLLNARNKRVKGETKEQWQTRVATADDEIPAAASALGQMVLTPVAARLGKKRLMIVADGALQYIPFAALPDPSGSMPQPLIVEHEIVSLPSASTLSVIRREVVGRQPAPKMIVALADPVFMKNDERLKRGVATANTSTKEAAPRAETVKELQLVEAVEDTGAGEGLYVPRLPGSRKEAEEIVAMTPAAQSKLALDFDASRAQATNPELSQYRYVHFSTHGFLNSMHPELSGVVFSLVNERGEAQDGFLRAHEVFNLKLPAELVVLSACQTGIGKEVKGEGLVSLTRGFMYAGAPRVVVSLWSVSEMGTTELMVLFYRQMLKEGKTPAAALRAAQISLMKEKRWASPFYWAPFTLQGEWR